VVETIDTRTDGSDIEYAPQSELAEHLADAQRQIANLEAALLTSRQIGMAVGILMCRYSWTEDRAFDALRLASQRHHRKVRELANEVVLTGDLPVLTSRTSRPSTGPRSRLRLPSSRRCA